MKKYTTIWFGIMSILWNSCTNGQTQGAKTNLSATEFSKKIEQLPEAPLLDVRTEGEFSKSHLPNSINYDWNGNDFDKQIAHLDKAKPVLVYCLSGGRSASAAGKMRKEGFKEVYELEGGILKWRAAQLPETNDTKTNSGLTREQFAQMIPEDKMVLVDFYADWCAPCKKMKPFLDEISKERGKEVEVIRINADDNPTLCSELKIDALPTLKLYKKGQLTWSHVGYLDKSGIVSQLAE